MLRNGEILAKCKEADKFVKAEASYRVLESLTATKNGTLSMMVAFQELHLREMGVNVGRCYPLYQVYKAVKNGKF